MRTPCGLVLAALVLASVGCGPQPNSPGQPEIKPQAPLTQDQLVENPGYTRWATATVGTVVVYDETTDVAGMVTRGRREYTLTSRNEEVAEVESRDLNPADNQPLESGAQTLKQLRWMAKPSGKDADPARPAGTYATGEEEVTVSGKQFKTRWYKFKGRVEAGETDTQEWYSTEVAGGLVKAVHRIPAAKKSVTTELAEVRTP